MKLSSIVNLLAGTLSPADFSASISEELLAHTRQLQKLGGSAPVVVSEDADVVLDRRGIASLCRLFASGQLTATELAYTADALQLSERVEFTDQKIAEYLAECTDPVINGPLSVSRALEIASNGAAA
jgi:CRP-like cAMP-binding protein